MEIIKYNIDEGKQKIGVDVQAEAEKPAGSPAAGKTKRDLDIARITVWITGLANIKGPYCSDKTLDDLVRSAERKIHGVAEALRQWVMEMKNDRIE